MNELLAGLALYPTLRDVPRPALEASGPLWSSRHLNRGDVLWKQGDPSDGLAIVLRGEVEALVDELQLGVVGNGGILGEVSAFLEGNPRSATVVALGGLDLAVLSREAIGALRAQQSPVYTALLDQGLRALVRRVRAADRRIASLAPGGESVPVRQAPGALAKLWRKLVPGLPAGECPPIEPLLRKQPGMSDVSDEVVRILAGPFTAVALPEGEVLCLENEPGDCAWVIAEGRVDVLRAVKDDRAERLATLGPGDLLGINTLVERTPRTASCVTATPTWVWKVSQETSSRLRGEAGIVWKEMLLASLATQLRLAHKTLQRVATGANADGTFGEDFDRLLHAQGYLEGLPVDADVTRARPVRPGPGSWPVG